MSKYNYITAVRLTFACAFIFCGIYPLTIWGIAQLTPNKGLGETVTYNGNRQYTYIGQEFVSEKYFFSRPSSVQYNAAGSAGSNKGPSNPEYLAQVQQRIDSLLILHPEKKVNEIPSDFITASGSGLDPHISVETAMFQAERVAKARNIPLNSVVNAINNHIEKPVMGLFGINKVNVVMLNINLDSLQ